jgi:hypothetical protein
MSQQELLSRVVGVLDAAGIPYMVTGSVVSSLQGEPRATHDIDIVVALDERHADTLVRAFPPPDFYVDRESIVDAIRSHGSFNLIHVTEGVKVDFWILTEQPFDRSRFARRIEEQLPTARVRVSRPEDTILVKLWWAKRSGGSERQFGDALRVFEVQYGTLDMAYLDRWASVLNVDDLLTRLRSEAEPL